MGGLITTTSSSTLSGIKVGNTYINAIAARMILQNVDEIRFASGTSWDYDRWAGLKYTHSNKTIYLGIADGTYFTKNNTAQTGGTLRLVSCGLYVPDASTFASTVTAPTFVGALSGTATAAIVVSGRSLTGTYATDSSMGLTVSSGDSSLDGYALNGSMNTVLTAGYGIARCFQLQAQKGSNVLRFRSGNSDMNAWLDWKTVAFTDSNITGNAATCTTASTLQGYDAVSIHRSGWNTIYRTGNSYSVIKWSRIGRITSTASDNLNNDAYIEIYVSGDQNYATFIKGTLMVNSYASVSRNIWLTSVGNASDSSRVLHLYACIDSDNYIWLGHNSVYTGQAKFRVRWTGSCVTWYTTGYSTLLSSSSNPATNYITDDGVMTGANGTVTGYTGISYTSAVKLATARTLWGQSFNGSANVSGSMTGVGNMTMNGGSMITTNTTDTSDSRAWYGLTFSTTDTTYKRITLSSYFGLWYRTGGTSYPHVFTGGKVGINTTAPSVALHVVGDTLSTGEVTAGSDIRHKSITEYLPEIAPEKISAAPIFKFRWTDRDDDKIHIGTSAQYWQEILPEIVTGTDFLTLNYPVLATILAVQASRRIDRIEQRILVLEQENEQLKQEISKLKNV
jgi:hypothetical protein